MHCPQQPTKTFGETHIGRETPITLACATTHYYARLVGQEAVVQHSGANSTDLQGTHLFRRRRHRLLEILHMYNLVQLSQSPLPAPIYTPLYL